MKMQIRNEAENLKLVNLGYDSAEAAEISNVLDRNGYQGLLLGVLFESVLAEDETITLTVEADNGTTSDFSASYETIQSATVIATGRTGGSTESGVYQLPLDISTWEQYAKFRTTLATSSGSDNIDYSLVAVLTNPNKKPYSSVGVSDSVDIS